MTDDKQKKSDYTSSSIKVLEGLEAVRKRPGMYIGSTQSEGLHHLIWEIVDNSIDEAMGGYASFVRVTITKDNQIRVEDDGRGIPVGIHEKTGRSGVETVLTVLHAGGKFDNDAYKMSGGLHGVGASCVNALSETFEVWVNKNHSVHYVKFINGGHAEAPLRVIAENDEKEHGTTIQFYPDFSIMEKNDWDEMKITSRLRQLAYLNKGIRIQFESEITNAKEEWLFEGGLVEYIHDLNEQKTPLFETVIFGEEERNVKAHNGDQTYDVICDLAFQYSNCYTSSVHSFCNNINTTEGGTHEEGFKLAILRIINRYAIDKKLIKEDEKFTKDDVVEGLTAIISIKHPNPQYEGQTKKKLGNSEVRPFVNDVTSVVFEKFLNENPDEAKIIINKAKIAAESRRRSNEAREATRRKSPFESSSLPGKLADCSNRDSSVTELYIVEGDSAGGSAKTGREREYQAILPLKGKIINVEKAKIEKIFANEEIQNMITAIGAGIGSEFNYEKLRYNKIIIMTDADVDGSHIRILLLTFFYRYMLELVQKGNIYIAQPPLYKVSFGKKVLYAYTEKELQEIRETAGNVRLNLQRYKGLGEMNPEQLWETTMDPQHRMLLKVDVEDAAEADKTFSLLMGDDVLPRKDFIAKNAKYAKNIDA
ncbi:DNA topoisomerase (ATP-hydrolyzing) subunit B [Ureaplasma miroungigenitalium]|uniref:DNA gyrase subunit B n=1 Tax=Ureaplasma miroungigenitalium TaxID=1042321 RepID=A0ABT3BMX1_9BACT|nr:DNA topoisomerase (ATP-hydrolyzing) subunit B [Ureaplasma miroungigenitalium]MCV3728497.1 DNA topoisomerase (ATP-hydrolyzing) subunit B [Ureaplasma miroungigenitalium]MCV3734284.1 DNA topoisomerase (ATP-hydrolyzing) subunit B [Ureaplasma miroungigenitalium]